MPSRIQTTVIILLILAAAVTGTCLALLSGNTIYPGVRANGISLSRLTRKQAENRLSPIAAGMSDAPVTLRYRGQVLHASAADLGGRIDIDACVESAYRVGRDGNILRRITDILSARQSGIDLPLNYTFDANQAAAYLRPVAEKFDRPAVDARLKVDGDSIQILPEQFGTEMKLDATVARIAQAINSGIRDVDVVVGTDSPHISADELQGIDSVLASYSTAYKPWQRDRTHNLQIACQAIDGTLLKPGEVFSYNKIVGPREKKYGFLDAPMFVDGEVEPGTGGGVCQISTTVYNAALLANLKIRRRQHHSRPVAYAPVGRDATVAYPYLDLKFENTTGAPIYITASVGRRSVDVRILGKKQPGREIALVSEDHKIIPPPTEEQIDDTLTAGARVVKDRGRKGHRVSIYRIVKLDGNAVKKELISKNYYKPGSRIVAIPGKQRSSNNLLKE